ncbi:MAG: proteasome accessory factor PafA2 family protein [Armatimonadetes bacterium]|nr:proteasome accessory factor PafA2 family protein [Armatimonadota bacterium]
MKPLKGISGLFKSGESMLGRRVFGIETEFGCLIRDDSLGGAETVVEAVKNHAFYKAGLGLIDLTARDEAFEPARSGGFLKNGSRLYIDAVGSHLEFATAECASLFDLVAHEKAGQRIIVNILREMGWDDKVSFYNNNVDHFGGHTFGCHENYLIRADERYPADAFNLILPFLITRQIYGGSGRVGGHILEHSNTLPSLRDMAQHPIDFIWVSQVYNVLPDPTVKFQLSQRADHIVRVTASRVRFNRAIINPKWDSVYGSSNYQRLHLLYGEGNMSEYAFALKIGATCLVLDLMEARALPSYLRIQDPLNAMRHISRDETRKWIVHLIDGDSISAIDLQRAYLALAQKRFAGRDAETDWVLTEWDYVLNLLETDPEQLDDRIDWVIKQNILREYMEDAGVDWDDDSLHSIDLEYHNINPDQGLYHALEEMGAVKRVVTDERIETATEQAPTNTRAGARATIVKKLCESRPSKYYVDWDMVYVDRMRQIDLRDPFGSYSKEVSRFLTWL